MGANRLADSLSPYLLAHAHDPVDWQPWGEGAQGQARREDRPIMLSVGYAACHWCHVMQHESFQDAAIARAINRDFVAVKVDREELPDVDQVYQNVCQAVTGQGGWPLTAFLTPDLRPFHIGTYYPPVRRYGRPGFPEVLQAVRDAFLQRRDKVEEVARSWSGVADSPLPQVAGTADVAEPDAALARAAAALLAHYDSRRGGFGGAPKFPQAPYLSLLLRAAQRLGDQAALGAVRHTLRAMERGGIHDQLGGGFHRYSVDARWQVPHFEKMLEDQALLAPLYTAIWQALGDDWALGAARRALAYVDEVLSDPAGGFCTAQDADSPGGEGAYYRFPARQLEGLLGKDAKVASLRYGLDDPQLAEAGVLQDRRTAQEVAQATGAAEAEILAALERVSMTLLAERQRRVPPACDGKVLAGATGLAVSAFARLGAACGEMRWIDRARRAAEFALTLRQTDGTLHRRYYQGRSGIPGYLEDYAGLGQGLLELYLADGDLRWLDAAVDLARRAVSLFWDEAAGELYSASRDASTPLVRPTDRQDGARPSAQSRMLRLLLLLGAFAEDLPAGSIAERIFASQQALWSDHPLACPSLVEARDLYLQGPRELTIAAPAGDHQAADWLRRARAVSSPDLLPTWIVPGRDFALWQAKAPLDGRATLYACRLGSCSPPLHDLEAALAFLDVRPT